MLKAVHKHFPDTVVTYRKGKDFLGHAVINFKFASGEASSHSEKDFFELFTPIKPNTVAKKYRDQAMDQAMRDIGMVKVKSDSGRVYWE